MDAGGGGWQRVAAGGGGRRMVCGGRVASGLRPAAGLPTAAARPPAPPCPPAPSPAPLRPTRSGAVPPSDGRRCSPLGGGVACGWVGGWGGVGWGWGLSGTCGTGAAQAERSGALGEGTKAICYQCSAAGFPAHSHIGTRSPRATSSALALTAAICCRWRRRGSSNSRLLIAAGLANCILRP